MTWKVKGKRAKVSLSPGRDARGKRQSKSAKGKGSPAKSSGNPVQDFKHPSQWSSTVQSSLIAQSCPTLCNSLVKEINPESSLEGLMLKLKLQYSGHLMRRANSLD